MTVIADTSPLQYAVEIDVADTLFMLYGRIVEARRRGLRITGLLGVIRDAALRGFLDFDDAIRKLRNTDFRVSPEVEALVRRQYGERSR